MGSPPHPRGSTVSDLGKPFREIVSPAPAGIDLLWPLSYFLRVRLPRTRGDRPLRSGSGIPVGWSPPHPRGSTGAGKRHEAFALVSPAPAGIDPFAASRISQSQRLPRTRGDRPQTGRRGGKEKRSPPHPRGSTWWMLGVRNNLIVSPAPAGIDPGHHPPATLWWRLPRTRGDRPLSPCWNTPHKTSPPHPRGSTPVFRLQALAGEVSPAPAGIDPAICSTVRSTLCLPRTRGDRPWPQIWSTMPAESPPHPRGSTSRFCFV